MAHLKSLFSWTLEPRGRRFFSCSNEPRGRGGQEAGEVLAFPPPLGTDSMRRMPRPRWSEAEPRCERLIADGAANAATEVERSGTEVRAAHCGRSGECRNRGASGSLRTAGGRDAQALPIYFSYSSLERCSYSAACSVIPFLARIFAFTS